ncbi:rRNA maturation RNase YbeY [Dysgonomonas hofstadii]|uniref:Endoribonuclease YbeY n=1 Tax=Dysgonomonas hofstadii TaxID=637886 RepID=A0A840CSJ2_9BACT|nr:rRNA maturation RNase YbeY [Dysgonomonas hofstadii]MBB4037108.1 rRNA maturation RNase YbeY [Dysgonomonas hofstadii]
MAVLYYSDGVKVPSFKRREMTNWIKSVAALHNKKVGTIAYIFCNDEKILEVNKQYLQHDYYTDIITFEYNEEDSLFGDIYISLDTVKSNSEQFDTDYNEELYRVIIHGVLHLCGINDKTPEEQECMTRCENEALKLL